MQLSSEAIGLQEELASSANIQTPIELGSLGLVAGVDVSVKDEVSRAAIVVMTFPALETVEVISAAYPNGAPGGRGF